jgi:hypothetical protein
VLHLVQVVLEILVLGYVGLLALDVVIFLFEQSKLWGCVALTLVIVAVRVIGQHIR